MLSEPLKVYLELFFEAMKSVVENKISFVMEEWVENRKGVCEVNEILRSVHCSMKTLKSYGTTNIYGLKKTKYDDALQKFNICFNATVIGEVLKVVIIIYMSRRLCSVMEGTDNEQN